MICNHHVGAERHAKSDWVNGKTPEMLEHHEPAGALELFLFCSSFCWSFFFDHMS